MHIDLLFLSDFSISSVVRVFTIFYHFHYLSQFPTLFTIFHHLSPTFTIFTIFHHASAFQHITNIPIISSIPAYSNIYHMLQHFQHASILQRFAMFSYVWRSLPSIASSPRFAAFVYFAAFTFPMLVSHFSVIQCRLTRFRVALRSFTAFTAFCIFCIIYISIACAIF